MRIDGEEVSFSFCWRGCMGLVSAFNRGWKPGSRWAGIHLFVKPSLDEYYVRRGGREVVEESYWVWGRATEIYDHNGEYFGLGPLLLVCW